MKLHPVALAEFKFHVIAEYPKEAVGVIVDGQFVKMENKSSDPNHSFILSAQDLLKVMTEKGKIEAILHSHVIDPKNHANQFPEYPSEQDLKEWIDDKIPWGIVSTDGRGVSAILWLDDDDRQPLIGRKFIWGVQDCYSIVRDYYKQERNIDLPNFVRSHGWEARGEDLFLKNFEIAGFKQIAKKDAQISDLILYQIRANTPNHIAVITGPNTAIHQLAYRESAYQCRSDWCFFERLFLHYEPK